MNFIRLINLPLSIRAFTKQDSEGNYNIYINDNLSDEQKAKSLAHEFRHISNGDFQSELTAHEIEEVYNAKN